MHKIYELTVDTANLDHGLWLRLCRNELHIAGGSSGSSGSVLVRDCHALLSNAEDTIGGVEDVEVADVAEALWKAKHEVLCKLDTGRRAIAETKFAAAVYI